MHSRLSDHNNYCDARLGALVPSSGSASPTPLVGKRGTPSDRAGCGDAIGQSPAGTTPTLRRPSPLPAGGRQFVKFMPWARKVRQNPGTFNHQRTGLAV